METKQGDKVEVIEGGREVRVWGTQYILEVGDCVVMRRENEEFGAFRVKTDITSGKVRDSGCDFKDLGAGGCLHACFCAQRGSPVEKTVSGVEGRLEGGCIGESKKGQPSVLGIR